MRSNNDLEDARDEAQKRMDAAAKALFQIPEIASKIHEFHDACQPDRLKHLPR